MMKANYPFIKRMALKYFSVMLFAACILSTSTAHAQLTGQILGCYIKSNDLDRIVQTYNFSRTWQEDKLTPLTYGYGGHLGWNVMLHKARQLHMVAQLGYMRFSSHSSNFGQENRIGFQRFSLAANFRFHPKAIIKGIQVSGPLGPRWFLTLGPELAMYLPYVRVNGKALLWDDDKPYAPRKTSMCFSFGTGYHLFNVGKLIFTFEIAATWAPFMELSEFAEAVNGHNVTGLRNEAKNVTIFNTGLRLSWVKSKLNWWSHPGKQK
jgi:hypothetical protein